MSEPTYHPAVEVDFGERQRELVHLVEKDADSDRPKPRVGAYDPDHMLAGEYAPEFPTKGTAMDHARWLAGLVQLDLDIRVEVTDNFGFGDGFAYRFYRTRRPDETSFVLMHVGTDYARISSFLEGMHYGLARAKYFNQGGLDVR